MIKQFNHLSNNMIKKEDEIIDELWQTISILNANEGGLDRKYLMGYRDALMFALGKK